MPGVYIDDPFDSSAEIAAEQPGAEAKTPAVADRRRPGRMENVSPHLIGLLRADHGAANPEAFDSDSLDEPAGIEEDRGDLAPARGIIAACLLGALAWAAIVAGIWLYHG